MTNRESSALWTSANDRFKSRDGNGLAVGVICAVAAHIALFVLFPPLQAAEASIPVEVVPVVPRPPAVDLPPPREKLERPAKPRVAATVLDEGPFRLIPPARGRQPELPRHRQGVRPDHTPSYIPHDVEPRLTNAREIARSLGQQYPSMLREAGIEGTVVLYVFVSAQGEPVKSQVARSSGHAMFDAAAAAVVERMEFMPALNRGRPVGVWVLQTVRFSTR